MNQSLSFLKYNNAVPLIMFAIFGMATASFAASPEARSAVYTSAEVVRQIDNTYIVSANIPSRDFKMQVIGVKEDTDMFYVAYSYNDISVVDYVWKDSTVTGTLTISKKELEGGDLGLFVAKQLGELVNAKRAYLVSVQEHEQRTGATTKVIATTYSGIVGKFLNADEQVFPGYVAVIAPVVTQPVSPTQAYVDPGEVNGAVSVSLPAPQQPQGLTQAQIEALVAEQVRAILAGTIPQPQVPTPITPETPTASSTDPVATSTPETPPVETTPAPTEPASESTVPPTPEPQANEAQ